MDARRLSQQELDAARRQFRSSSPQQQRETLAHNLGSITTLASDALELLSRFPDMDALPPVQQRQLSSIRDTTTKIHSMASDMALAFN